MGGGDWRWLIAIGGGRSGARWHLAEEAGHGLKAPVRVDRAEVGALDDRIAGGRHEFPRKAQAIAEAVDVGRAARRGHARRAAAGATGRGRPAARRSTARRERKRGAATRGERRRERRGG